MLFWHKIAKIPFQRHYFSQITRLEVNSFMLCLIYSCGNIIKIGYSTTLDKIVILQTSNLLVKERTAIFMQWNDIWMQYA